MHAVQKLDGVEKRKLANMDVNESKNENMSINDPQANEEKVVETFKGTNGKISAHYSHKTLSCCHLNL